MKNRLYCIAVKSEKQINAEILAAVDYIIFCPGEYTEKTVLAFINNMQSFFNSPVPVTPPCIYLNLPVVAMAEDIKVLRKLLENKNIKEKFSGVVANNVYALKLAGEYGLNVFKGPWMNTLNDNFCGYENVVLSPELSESEYRLFGDWDKKNYFLCVYGYLPLMTLAHCPYQVNGIECHRGRSADTKRSEVPQRGGGNLLSAVCMNSVPVTRTARLQYKDELNNVMNIRRTKLSKCYFELLNSVPLNLLKHKNKIKPHYYFDMRETEPVEISRILKLFKEPGNKDPEGKHTAGLYFKELK